jgi:hypothetical protein
MILFAMGFDQHSSINAIIGRFGFEAGFHLL